MPTTRPFHASGWSMIEAYGEGTRAGLTRQLPVIRVAAFERRPFWSITSTIEETRIRYGAEAARRMLKAAIKRNDCRWLTINKAAAMMSGATLGMVRADIAAGALHAVWVRLPDDRHLLRISSASVFAMDRINEYKGIRMGGEIVDDLAS